MHEKGYFLIVDDKKEARDAAVMVAKTLGYSEEKIFVARYGDEALEQYTRLCSEGKKIDLVLTDYHMDVISKPSEAISWSKKPEILDGIELTIRIRMLDQNQKVIIATGASRGNLIKECQHIR